MKKKKKKKTRKLEYFSICEMRFLYPFRVLRSTVSQYQRGITPKIVNQSYGLIWFESSARRLMVLNISEKICEIIWNGFKVTERIQVYDRNHYLQCSKGSNSIYM